MTDSPPPQPSAPQPTELDIAMMRRALELAKDAAGVGEVPVGAVVYETESGTILSEGANTRERDKDPAGHAEHNAIELACERLGDWRLNHCSLAVTLEPCAMCAGLIVNARIGRLIYGAHDPKAGAVRSLHRLCDDDRLNHRCVIIPQVLADESSAMLRSFFASLRTR